MDTGLKKIIFELNKCENEGKTIISALTGIVNKWESIRNAYSLYKDYLGIINGFPEIQSRLEVEQISSCDTLIAELGRQLVLYDHSITQAKASLAKTKQQLSEKPNDFPWSFPPSVSDISEDFLTAENAISQSLLSVEAKKYSLFELNQSENPLNPDNVMRMINKWSSSSP